MTIRPLATIDEFNRCVELQRDAFVATDLNLMPARSYVVLTQVGGLVLGAFEDDRLVAYVSAMIGLRKGVAYWHSQMLAVSRSHWSSGIGTQLKFAQRDEAIKRGIGLIEWTFDPLESKNAYLNIEKLGAIVRRYYANHYGRIHDVDSDRVVAEWWLGKPRIPVSGETRRLEIPANLHSLNKQDLQRRVREEFQKNFREDFFVVALERKEATSEYVFVRGASSVYP